MSILLGNGDGTFQAAQSYPTSDQCTSIVAADFNGDGHLDLAVGDEWAQTVNILLGNGDGTFRAPRSYYVASGAYSVTAADLNGDGILDLVVGGATAVSVLLGNGDGTFPPTRRYEVGPLALFVAVGDFNADGIPDLVLANDYTDNAVRILLGVGDGTFQPAQKYAAGPGPCSVVVADFNGDGIPDLAVANYGDGSGRNAGMSILLGKGDGTFLTAQFYPAGFAPYLLAVGDFNGDGHLDLAMTDRYTVTIFVGQGDGTFQIHALYAASYGPGSVAVGDFNGDGIPDLAVANEGSNTVTILLGNGNATFRAARSYQSWVGGSVAVGDFNGDSIPDLAVINGRGSNTVSILLGNRDGTLQPSQIHTVGPGPSGVAVGDFNGDGIPDLAVTNHPDTTPGTVSILLGKGDGTFQAAQPFAAGAGPNHLAVGDFNGDGKLDIVTSNFAVTFDPRHPQIIENDVRVFLGNGDGTFQPAQTYTLAGPQDSPAGFVAVGDFNSDGVPDLVVASITWGRLCVFLGNGDGTFQAAGDYAVGNTPFSVAVADFNGDGTLDLVVAQEGTSSDPGTVQILLGNGDGTFQAAVQYVVGGHPTWVAVGDFNRDGIPDLAVADDSGVSILLGNGDGTFQALHSYAAGSGGSLVVADFNGDGFPDLALATSVTILLNAADRPP